VLEIQFPDLIVSPTASFPPPKIPFGNRVLTMVSVWLGRKDALIALVLTCWQRMQASALDGPPMRHNKALALARLPPRSLRGRGTGSHLLPEDLGRLR
jgi:hypothetical protein